jgi:hypothetical protein
MSSPRAFESLRKGIMKNFVAGENRKQWKYNRSETYR